MELRSDALTSKCGEYSPRQLRDDGALFLICSERDVEIAEDGKVRAACIR
jgi:hypothetical protein